MTDLSDYLNQMMLGELPRVDWSVPPWSVVQPALHWLGVAPEPLQPTGTPRLSADDARILCDHMVRRFIDAEGNLAWSSHMLMTAVDAVMACLGGPPEPLVRSAWDVVDSRSLDRTLYEFCRSFGHTILSRHVNSGWDLQWMTNAATDGQICLRYWMLANKPELWTADVERATMSALSKYPFQF